MKYNLVMDSQRAPEENASLQKRALDARSDLLHACKLKRRKTAREELDEADKQSLEALRNGTLCYTSNLAVCALGHGTLEDEHGHVVRVNLDSD